MGIAEQHPSGAMRGAEEIPRRPYIELLVSAPGVRDTLGELGGHAV
jgi:hypothetical protein